MRLLFVEGVSRCYYDTDGNIYLGPNFHRGVQERYSKYCDRLVILNKTDGKIYSPSEIPPGQHKAEKSLADVISVPDLYRPRSNLFSLSTRKKIQDIMTRAISDSDRVIIHVAVNYYTSSAEKICRRLGKPYMIEIVEFVYKMNWYYGIEGKIIAPFSEMRAKNMVLNAPYVSYVTQREQQKIYPANGKSIGCSDVEIPELDRSILEKRIARINEAGTRNIIFGSAGSIGGYVKGHEHVIRALSILKSEGVTNIEYHIAGAGSPEKLKGLAESLGVIERVKFCGSLPHEKIFDWYDSLDVYVQPSMTEGLCRAIIEAMSRAIPVTCSDAGGNPELADKDMIFHAGNVRQISAAMKKLLDPDTRRRESVRSFERAHDFSKAKLDAVRNEFYSSFTGVKKW